ncbi:unnamed protein product [Adineta ricciae]|uniref:Uncharacterized protein n=2 Tax=Adineta ricciae TaxID=249248 RepID=A0A814VQW7_ADIRI|nr:unnamed protein product [Adineta ricciae]
MKRIKSIFNHKKSNKNEQTLREDFARNNFSGTSKLDLSNIEKEDSVDFRHRSCSLDENHLNFQEDSQWQCQLCDTINSTENQLCSNCQTNKFHVYIPMNHRDKPNHYRRSVLIAQKRQFDEHFVLKHVEKLYQNLLLTHRRFHDQSFPASSQSIYINGCSFSKSTLAVLPEHQTNLSLNRHIQWLRPNQINPSEWNQNSTSQWTVFRNPKPNDVVQGALGDCWFITALSVLAEEAEYLMKVLITKEYNPQGFYYVRLCKDGEWTQVIVDDRFPCTSSQRLAYSQAHRKQLWVPLIEKALAKLNGSYEAIIAGRCCEGLATVTGSPCETLILGRTNNPDDKNVDLDQLWMKLYNARLNKFLMCAMCSNNQLSKEEFQKAGLLNVHAYSLQDVKQSNDGKHRLVKLRNPWGGTYRWNGDWSDDSPLWLENADLRKELLKEKRSKRDGVFWMPFTSFVKYFECVDICKIRPDWYEVRDSANFYPEQGMMQCYYLTIKSRTELDITLHRKISKNLRIQRSEVSLCVAIVSIEERTAGNYRIYSIPILSQRGQHKFVSTDGFLQPGTYLILPFLFNPINKQMDNTEFNIAVHSSCSIDLERIRISLRIQREFLIKLCILYGEQVQTRNSMDDGVKIYELKKFWDGLILLVENRNLNKNVHFHFRCTLSQNAFISRKDSNHQLFDVIPSMHRQIIVTIARKNASHSFTIGHDFQYILSSQDFIKNSHINKQKHWPNIDESILSEDIHLPQSISNAKQQKEEIGPQNESTNSNSWESALKAATENLRCFISLRSTNPEIHVSDPSIGLFDLGSQSSEAQRKILLEREHRTKLQKEVNEFKELNGKLLRSNRQSRSELNELRNANVQGVISNTKKDHYK